MRHPVPAHVVVVDDPQVAQAIALFKAAQSAVVYNRTMSAIKALYPDPDLPDSLFADLVKGGGGHWITIHHATPDDDGEMVAHIFINSGGVVTKGPQHLIGAKAGHLPQVPHEGIGHKVSVTHHASGVTPEGHNAHPSYREFNPAVHAPAKRGGSPTPAPAPGEAPAPGAAKPAGRRGGGHFAAQREGVAPPTPGAEEDPTGAPAQGAAPGGMEAKPPRMARSQVARNLEHSLRESYTSKTGQPMPESFQGAFYGGMPHMAAPQAPAAAPGAPAAPEAAPQMGAAAPAPSAPPQATPAPAMAPQGAPSAPPPAPAAPPASAPAPAPAPAPTPQAAPAPETPAGGTHQPPAPAPMGGNQPSTPPSPPPAASDQPAAQSPAPAPSLGGSPAPAQAPGGGTAPGAQASSPIAQATQEARGRATQAMDEQLDKHWPPENFRGIAGSAHAGSYPAFRQYAHQVGQNMGQYLAHRNLADAHMSAGNDEKANVHRALMQGLEKKTDKEAGLISGAFHGDAESPPVQSHSEVPQQQYTPPAPWTVGHAPRASRSGSAAPGGAPAPAPTPQAAPSPAPAPKPAAPPAPAPSAPPAPAPAPAPAPKPAAPPAPAPAPAPEPKPEPAPEPPAPTSAAAPTPEPAAAAPQSFSPKMFADQTFGRLQQKTPAEYGHDQLHEQLGQVLAGSHPHVDPANNPMAKAMREQMPNTHLYNGHVELGRQYEEAAHELNTQHPPTDATHHEHAEALHELQSAANHHDSMAQQAEPGAEAEAGKDQELYHKHLPELDAAERQAQAPKPAPAPKAAPTSQPAPAPKAAPRAPASKPADVAAMGAKVNASQKNLDAVARQMEAAHKTGARSSHARLKAQHDQLSAAHAQLQTQHDQATIAHDTQEAAGKRDAGYKTQRVKEQAASATDDSHAAQHQAGHNEIARITNDMINLPKGSGAKRAEYAVRRQRAEKGLLKLNQEHPEPMEKLQDRRQAMAGKLESYQKALRSHQGKEVQAKTLREGGGYDHVAGYQKWQEGLHQRQTAVEEAGKNVAHLDRMVAEHPGSKPQAQEEMQAAAPEPETTKAEPTPEPQSAPPAETEALAAPAPKAKPARKPKAKPAPEAAPEPVARPEAPPAPPEPPKPPAPTKPETEPESTVASRPNGRAVEDIVAERKGARERLVAHMSSNPPKDDVGHMAWKKQGSMLQRRYDALSDEHRVAAHQAIVQGGRHALGSVPSGSPDIVNPGVQYFNHQDRKRDLVFHGRSLPNAVGRPPESAPGYEAAQAELLHHVEQFGKGGAHDLVHEGGGHYRLMPKGGHPTGDLGAQSAWNSGRAMGEHQVRANRIANEAHAKKAILREGINTLLQHAGVPRQELVGNRYAEMLTNHRNPTKYTGNESGGEVLGKLENSLRFWAHDSRSKPAAQQINWRRMLRHADAIAHHGLRLRHTA